MCISVTYLRFGVISFNTLCSRDQSKGRILVAVGGELHFDHLLVEHRSYQSMLDEWSGVTHVTFHDDSEWRAYWREVREGASKEKREEKRKVLL